MKCSACGFEISEKDALFCPSCGKKLEIPVYDAVSETSQPSAEADSDEMINKIQSALDGIIAYDDNMREEKREPVPQRLTYGNGGRPQESRGQTYYGNPYVAPDARSNASYGSSYAPSPVRNQGPQGNGYAPQPMRNQRPQGNGYAPQSVGNQRPQGNRYAPQSVGNQRPQGNIYAPPPAKNPMPHRNSYIPSPVSDTEARESPYAAFSADMPVHQEKTYETDKTSELSYGIPVYEAAADDKHIPVYQSTLDASEKKDKKKKPQQIRYGDGIYNGYEDKASSGNVKSVLITFGIGAGIAAVISGLIGIPVLLLALL